MFRVVHTYDYDHEHTTMMTAEQLREVLAEPLEEYEAYDVYTEDGEILWDEDLRELGLIA